MASSVKRFLGPILLTLVYWPIALIFLGLSLLGDCFAERAICEAGRRSAILTIGTVELALYAFLLASIMRPHTRAYWLVVTICLALLALGWLKIGLGM